MPIKANITATEFNVLSDEGKTNYKASGEGFAIDLSGGFITTKDPAALLNAKNHEQTLRKAAEKQLLDFKTAEQQKIDDATAKATADARKAALEGNDLTAITAQFDERFAAMEAKHANELSTRDADVAKQSALVKESRLNAAAAKIATAISIVPDLLVGKIQSRLELDDAGNVVAKDGTGGISPAFTMQALQKEFVDNTDYAAIMIGSKASGASGSQTNGSPVDTGGKVWADFTTEQLKQLHEEDPTGYQNLKATK